MNIVSTAAILAAVALAEFAFAWVDPAAAQTVRRNLRCELVATIAPDSGGILPDFSAQTARITNPWSLTIPTGTTFTVFVARKRSTFTSSKALGAGQSLFVGRYSGVNPPTCLASVPG